MLQQRLWKKLIHGFVQQGKTAISIMMLDKTVGDFCQEHKLKYYRYMDDWLILCRTRNQLRTVVRLMNQCLVAVKQTKHPFKTYIGRIKDEGFDFLGYRIAKRNKEKLGLAWKSWANHFSKIQQLYEQGAKHKRIAEYTKRWLIWVRSGVKVNLQQLVKYGLNSDIGKSLSEKMPMADFYRQAGVVGL